MKSALLWLLLIWTRYPEAVVAQRDETVIIVTAIDSRGNSVIGTTSVDGAVDSFLGIPFATVGERFTPSEPLGGDNIGSGTTSGGGNITIINTTSFGPTCYQPDLGPPPGMDAVPPPNHSEECLYLNLWRPSSDVNDTSSSFPLLPVMVSVHGGGFMAGSGGNPVYDGSALAREQGVIVVTFNYRLGVFGQLVTNPASGEGGMNWLEDQINALRWIGEHVESFGGDPDRVTIMGESAGATSVCMLSVSPLARGLFHRAVIQSGPCVYFSLQPHSPDVGWAQTRSFLNASGATSVDELVTNYSPEELLEVRGTVFTTPGTIDGRVMPALPLDLFKSGAESINPGQVMIGATSFDDVSAMFLPAQAFVATASQFDDYIRGLFDAQHGAAASERILEAYSPSAVYGGSNVSALAQFHGDFMFKCQGRELAAILASAGIPTYLYSFDHYSDNDLSNLNGLLALANVTDPTWASHTSELPFVFGNLDVTFAGPAPNPPTAADMDLREELMSRWAAFARTGNPNIDASPGVAEATTAATWQAVPADVALPSPEGGGGGTASNVSELVFLSMNRSAMSFDKTTQCSAIPDIAALRTTDPAAAVPPPQQPTPSPTTTTTTGTTSGAPQRRSPGCVLALLLEASVIVLLACSFYY